MTKAVVYLRVSTREQGKSGLGLAAQQTAVARFCENNAFEIVAEFQDVASGKLAACFRDGLTRALAKARKLKCPVIVAKLDRLSRDVSFISSLMNDDVSFICADLGADVEPFMLHIHASVAERERKLIGIRTKAGIAEKIKRGGAHGHIESLAAARVLASEAKGATALKVALAVHPIISALIQSGFSLRAVARQLNQSNTPTSVKGLWTATAVTRVLNRIKDCPPGI